jgi:hypothetical protein
VGVLHQFSDIETQTKATQQNVFICHRISNVSEEMCQAEREKESRKLEEKKTVGFCFIKIFINLQQPEKTMYSVYTKSQAADKIIRDQDLAKMLYVLF